ncbi:oligomeric complex COG6 [Pisolithus thermaeus]|nr:oligomeric complex COG6 [Pisolithus thermaeus]
MPSDTATRNPITHRLRKILATSFTDPTTVEALQTLSQLYSAPRPDNSVDAANGDSDEWSESDGDDAEQQHPQDGVIDETAARARKNLQRDLENKLAQDSEHFLRAFGEVNQKLDDLEGLVAEMRMYCDEAEAQVGLTKAASQSLLEHAENLQQERHQVETRKSIVTLFLDRFTLTDAEIDALTSRDVPVGARFFLAMDKTARIRVDCRVLMSGEDGPTKAGMDIMSTTSSYLEQGYDKIYRWCTFEFRRLGTENHLEVSPTMVESVRRLSQRPELLSEALAVLSQTKQNALLNLFLNALTRGGPSGLPRPIELHAHDPIRYIGDMLAWVHQAIAAECEFFESLFGISGRAKRMVGEVRVAGSSVEEEWVGELLDVGVRKLCVPLKLRVLHTIRAQDDGIVCYKIANLLQYYTLTMQRTIGDRSVLSGALREITQASYKVFFNTIEAQGRAILRIPLDLDDPSLAPPNFIMDHAQVLREIMLVYDSSLLDGGTDPYPVRGAGEVNDGNGRDDAGTRNDEIDSGANADAAKGFRRILDIMIDPAIAMCAAASEEKARARPQWDSAVFVLNCLCYLKNVLEPFSFTRDKQEEIEGIIQDRLCALEDDHYNHILRDASLWDVVRAMETKDPVTPLSRLPATEPAALQLALSKFSLWLSTPDTVSSPRLAPLSSAAIAGRVHRAALRRLVRAYGSLCEEVKSGKARYEAGSVLLGRERPFGQVGLLWQIFGLVEEGDAY